jgi:hypothetical protein
MIYFALNEDGLIYNLGDHGDWVAADSTANDMMINPIWTIDENEARNWAQFITEQLKTTTSTGAE